MLNFTSPKFISDVTSLNRSKRLNGCFVGGGIRVTVRKEFMKFISLSLVECMFLTKNVNYLDVFTLKI